MIKNIIFLSAILLIASDCMADFECNDEDCPPTSKYPFAYKVSITGLKRYPCDATGLDGPVCDFEGENCIRGCDEEDASDVGGILCPSGLPIGRYSTTSTVGGDPVITLVLFCDENGNPKVHIHAGGINCHGSSDFFDGDGFGVEGSASNDWTNVCNTAGPFLSGLNQDEWGGTATYTPIWNCSTCGNDDCSTEMVIIKDPDVTMHYPTKKCCGSNGGKPKTFKISCSGATHLINASYTGGEGKVNVTVTPQECTTSPLVATFVVTTVEADSFDEDTLTLTAEFYHTPNPEEHFQSGSIDVQLKPACGSCCDDDCTKCPKGVEVP